MPNPATDLLVIELSTGGESGCSRISSSCGSLSSSSVSSFRNFLCFLLDPLHWYPLFIGKK